MDAYCASRGRFAIASPLGHRVMLRALEGEELVHGANRVGVARSNRQLAAALECADRVTNHRPLRRHDPGARHILRMDYHWRREIASRKCARDRSQVGSNTSCADCVVDGTKQCDATAIRQVVESMARCVL